jgi:hypothetical protein
MTRLGLRIIVAFGILLLMPLAVSAQVLPPGSIWENQRTSTLSVESVTGNHFDGWFINRAAGFQCQNFPYRATGTILPNGAITFTVNFTQCQTVTIWKGRVTGSQMPTKWTLYYQGVPRMMGDDFFKRVQFLLF